MAKAVKKQVLGRGLDSILNDTNNKNNPLSKISKDSSSNIEVSKISLNPFQPRSTFDK